MRQKYIRTNPLEDVKPPKEKHNEKDVPAPEQVRLLLDDVRGDRLEAVFCRGALGGLKNWGALGFG